MLECPVVVSDSAELLCVSRFGSSCGSLETARPTENMQHAVSDHTLNRLRLGSYL